MDTDGRQENERMEPQIDADGGEENHGLTRMDTDWVEPPRRQENERMEPQIDADGRRGREAHAETRRHGGAEGD